MASVKKIASELNWELDGRTCYGIEDGFTVTLHENRDFSNAQNNVKHIYIPINEAPSANSENLHNFLLENQKDFRIYGFEINKRIIVIRIKEIFKGISIEDFKEMLPKITGALKSNGFTPFDKCVYCLEEDPDGVTYLNDVRFPSHDTCKHEAIEKNKQKEIDRDNFRNEPSAILGTVLGAIVGAIPYAIAVWFGWYVGALTIITGFASYEGFKRFDGVTTNLTKYYVSAISFLVLILSNFVLIGLIAITYGITFADVLSVGDMSAAFTEALVMSSIFGLIGILAIFSRIKRDEYRAKIK